MRKLGEGRLSKLSFVVRLGDDNIVSIAVFIKKYYIS